MSGFFKNRDFFKKSVLLKTAEFSVSDTGDPLILTCLSTTKPPCQSLSRYRKGSNYIQNWFIFLNKLLCYSLIFKLSSFMVQLTHLRPIEFPIKFDTVKPGWSIV